MNGPDGRFAPIPIRERIRSNVAIQDDGCWQWTGTLSDAGYPYMRLTRTKRARAHRVSYEAFVGPIPDELQIDHTCHNNSGCPGGATCPHRACVNPEHLEPVTNRVNTLRSESFTAVNAAKGACIHGHEFTAENTYVNPRRGNRSCRTCRRAIEARYRARKAAA